MKGHRGAAKKKGSVLPVRRKRGNQDILGSTYQPAILAGDNPLHQAFARVLHTLSEFREGS
jgi:hypothetical protein